MTAISLIGYIAYVLTTGALIPQVYKTIKTRSTGDLSLSTFIFFFAGTVLWLIYGLSIQDPFLAVANGIMGVLSGIILFMKVTTMKRKKR
jgi:MtN3 and saliva related transmembrane protein